MLDLRVITATNRSLKLMSRQNQFRADLYYRLCVLEIRVPPLRDHLEDLPLLLDHFLQRISEKAGRRTPQVTPDAIEYLKTYEWPGNVRQLKHMIERALAMGSGGASLGRRADEPAVKDKRR